MRIRIELTDENRVVESMLLSGQFENKDKNSEQIAIGVRSMPQPEVRITDIIPQNYKSDYYDMPVTTVDVTYTDADKSAVSEWLKGGGASVQVGSTSVQRMTSAVIGAAEEYYDSTARLGIFTRPFQICLALRLNDGKVTARSKPLLLKGESIAPLMKIRNYTLRDNLLHTITEIDNTPQKIEIKIPEFQIPEELSRQVERVLVGITRQFDPWSGYESVTGIRQLSEASGNKIPYWFYQRLDINQVMAGATADTDFRIIADYALEDKSWHPLAEEGKIDLTRIDKFPKLPADSNPESGENPERPDLPGYDDTKLVRLITEPLDLGYPEHRKHVSALTVRGIFERENWERMPVVTLWGSAHRDRWHKVAQTRGWELSMLRSAAFRWWRVEILAYGTSRFDALVFKLALTKQNEAWF
ncbi:MAG: hypothetical protein K2M87_08235 [Muribaculaceae bacterium]|nr:hypothetical protein [Muribaculaceae bacterium]